MRECTITGVGRSGVMGGGSWEKSATELVGMDEGEIVVPCVVA